MAAQGNNANPVNIAFALCPAAATQGLIDYSTREGQKLYSRGVEAVSTELFDCEPDGMHTFIKAVKMRANEYGWATEGVGIMSIPDDPHAMNPTYTNLLTNYGEISLETIRAFEETYLHGASRAVQDSYMLFQALMASLSATALKKINLFEDQYTVGDRMSGNLLFKVVIRESHLDSNATTTSIRTKLSSLDTYMPTIGNDILKFNQYVMLLLDQLAARGETTTDLLTNLFKGYLATSDKKFVEYIERKQEMHEDGEDIEYNDLMLLAANKYKYMKLKNEWEAPSLEEQKILALEAKYDAKFRQLGKSSRKTQTDNKKGDSKKPTHKKKEKPEWMINSSRPKDPELKKPKQWDKKDWWWCHPDTGGKCEGAWRIHKPSECKGAAKRKATDTQKKENKSNKKKLAKALAAVVEKEASTDSE